MFRRVMQFQLFQQTPGLSRREYLIEGGWSMGIQVIHHQHNLLGVRIVDIDHLPDEAGPIHFRPLGRDLRIALARQRFTGQKDVADAMPLILVILPLRMTWFHGERESLLTQELFADLIHAHLWKARIIRADIDRQHILHMGHKVGIGFGGDTPLLF